ncbi:MAG: DegV family protein [Peptococcaceae bacterium]|nr:DegV family protein [Peptococcaceae bacterium]
MIEIVADSTCDLPKNLIEEYNIHVLPLHILLGEEDHLDGVDLTLEELFAWSDAHQATPKTSAPSLQEAIVLLEPLVATGAEVVCLPISAKLSASGDVLRLAAEKLGATDQVHIIDTKNVSTGLGVLAMKAAQMARDGADVQEIIRTMEDLSARLTVTFIVDTLTYLYRGGRCSGVAALFGNVLRIHPRILVNDEGALVPDKKYRGKMDHVTQVYLEEMLPLLAEADPMCAFLIHSTCTQAEIDAAVAKIRALGHFEHILVGCTGGVVSSHCGPGTFCIGYFKHA